MKRTKVSFIFCAQSQFESIRCWKFFGEGLRFL